MANLFKSIDILGLGDFVKRITLSIRQFFATKSEMDVVVTALNDLDKRKIEISDIPPSLPADGGNADTVDGLHANDFVQNITVDTVTTGEPGTSANVTASKTNSDVTLYFTIPRGADGKNGTNGKDGVSPTIEIGTVTTVPST